MNYSLNFFPLTNIYVHFILLQCLVKLMMRNYKNGILDLITLTLVRMISYRLSILSYGNRYIPLNQLSEVLNFCHLLPQMILELMEVWAQSVVQVKVTTLSNLNNQDWEERHLRFVLIRFMAVVKN